MTTPITPTEELRDAITARLQAMYFSAYEIENLDTGKIEPKKDIDDATKVHLYAVFALFEQFATRRVIRKQLDEAKSFYIHIEALGALHGPEFLQTGILKYAYERVQALEASLIDGEKK